MEIDETTKQFYEGAFLGFGYFSEADVRNMILQSSLDICKLDSFVKIEHTDYYKIKRNSKKVRKMAILNNASNYLGYIPGIGIVTGFLKIFKGSFIKGNHSFIDPKLDILKKRTLNVRGMVEIYGFGVLCIVYDIYSTIQRKRHPFIIQGEY